VARVQTQYQNEQAGSQVIDPGMLQAVQAKFDPNDSGAFQLAKQLGALDFTQLTNTAKQIQTQQALDARQQAEKYANSITAEELGKRIKDGTMLPSQSPLFIGALQHIYGENTQQAIERDTISKLQSGELKFGTTQEADQYLTEQRNKALEGQTSYTTAGFDKGYGTFRQKLFDVNAKVMNAQNEQRGIQEASDNLGNVLLQVSDPMFKGTKSDAADALVQRYQLLRKSSLLRDDAAKEALSGVLANMAMSGDKELVNTFLSKQLDNGVSVRAVVGDLKADSFIQHAETKYDQFQRQRVDQEIRPFVFQADKGELDEKKFNDYIAANEKYLTTPQIHAIVNGNRHAQERLKNELLKGQMLAMAQESEQRATSAVQLAVDQGNLAFLPQQKVMTPNGESKDFDAKKAAQGYISQRAAQLPFGKQVEMWSTNGVENPEWEKQIKAGVSNLSSIGWQFDGKNIGQLNEQGQATIDTFMRINKVNPGYAEKLTGGGKDYKMLSDIQFLMERGNMPLNDAAARVNQAERSGIGKDDYGSLTKKVSSAVDDVVNPHWYSKPVSWVSGLFGNDQVNLTAVKGDLSRMAELLVKTGQVPDADAAVKASAEYLANPAITSKINNTLYFNKDLPTVPKGEDPGKWMERFIHDVPGVVAASKSISHRDVRLEPNQYGGFTACTAGVPLTDANGNVVSYSKDQISQWIGSTYDGDLHKKADEANFQAYQKRLEGEMAKRLGKDSLPGAGQGAISATMSQIGSREFYDQMVSEGKQNLPQQELLKLYRERNKTK